MNTGSVQMKKIYKPKKFSNTQQRNRQQTLLKDQTQTFDEIQDGAHEITGSELENYYHQSHNQEQFNTFKNDNQLKEQFVSPYNKLNENYFIQKNQQFVGSATTICYFTEMRDKSCSSIQYRQDQINKVGIQSSMEEEIEEYNSHQSSSPLLIYEDQNEKVQENQKNNDSESSSSQQINEQTNFQQQFSKQDSFFSERSYQPDSQTLVKRCVNKLKKNLIMNKLKQIPSYKILPIDYEDLPINEFHLYGDIFINLECSKLISQTQMNGQQVVVPSNNKQMNPLFQWKHIQEMKNCKKELIFNLTNKTETKKDFNSIIKIIKARNQNQNLGQLLIEAENKINKIQNYIKDGFTLMRQNGLIDLFYQRRQLFESKCEFFLKEISGQKKYIYLKSYYNEDKLEIEDTQMGISTNFVEILSSTHVNQVVYKIMRGNYPEIFGSKLKELFSYQSVIRLLNLECNEYQELSFENVELNTLDGLTFPTTMTVKRVQFKFDPVYENLPLQDKFIYIEFNISPKVLQQLNKIRKEIQTPQPQTNIIQMNPKPLSASSNNEDDLKKSQNFIFEFNQESQKQQNQNEESIKNNNLQMNEQTCSDLKGEPINKSNTQNLSEQKLKQNAINSIKSKRRKQRGIIKEDEKDFYYEMQTQILLDKFYNYEEISELIKQSDQINGQNPQTNENQYQNKIFFSI